MALARKPTSRDRLFLLFVLIMTILYAVHLFSFTLFEGFSTFSNDAGTYVLLAQKWSPYYVPSEALNATWPTQVLPPGLSWALAITGASKSLWLSHLLVSVCLLLSIGLVGWILCRLGLLIGGLVFIALVLLPGAVVASLGILSENLYLLISLCILLLYSGMVKNRSTSWLLYLLLFMGFALVILTRTIGIALIAAVFSVAILDRSLLLKQKINSVLAVAASIFVWQLWGYVNPQESDHTYGVLLNQFFASDGTIGGVIQTVLQGITINFMQILSYWGRYFSLGLANVWMFLFSYLLLVVCIAGLLLRIRQLKVDAVYLVFYFAILLLWPYPDQLQRFLHPVMFLLLLQPVLALYDKPAVFNNKLTKPALIAFLTILILNSSMTHFELSHRQTLAMKANPLLAHSYEFYDSHSLNTGAMRATAFIEIMDAMKFSSQLVPLDSIVATNKHSNYAILSNRQAVNLATVVSYSQQVCNLKAEDVDVVFLSDLTTSSDGEGQNQIEKYRKFSSNIVELKGNDGKIVATLITIDKNKLETELANTGFECLKYSDQI